MENPSPKGASIHPTKGEALVLASRSSAQKHVSPFAPRKNAFFRGAKGDTQPATGPARGQKVDGVESEGISGRGGVLSHIVEPDMVPAGREGVGPQLQGPRRETRPQ